VTQRLILVLLLVSVVPAPAAAQSVQSGIKGGITLATVPEIAQALDFDASTSGFRPGVVAGLFVAFGANDWFAIQPELLYVQKGVDLEVPVGRLRLETDYVEIPVLAKLAGGRGLRAYLFGGPTFAWRLNARAITEVGSVSSEEDATEDVRRTDVGFALGGGIELGFLLVEARLTEGLTPINEPTAEIDRDVRNRVFAFMAGIKF